MAYGDLENQEPDESNGPQDIAAAFQILKRKREEGADDPMGGEEAGGDEDPDEEEPETTPEPETEPDDGDDADGGAAGGYPDDGEQLPQAIDYGRISKSLVNEINKEAAQSANRIFASKGIKKFSIGDLYERNEKTGVVRFQNPDDPSRPFESRAEAQSWVEAMNKQIDAEWRNVAVQEQQRIAKDAAPRLRLMQFAPKFEKMSKDMQELFDDVIEGYEVRDPEGRVVGYSCDLDAAYKQAKKIKSMIDKRAPQGNEEGQGSSQVSKSGRPATDMRTGKVEKQEAKEPTSLEEAMKMYNAQKKKGN